MRDVTREPLSEDEVRALGARLGGVRELVGPKRREELAGLDEEALVRHLAGNPGHLRRPLIDTGTQLVAGFTAGVRESLEGAWKKKR